MVPRLTADSIRSEWTWTRHVVGARRLALHLALFAATFLTTTIVGVVLWQGFYSGTPVSLERYIDILPSIWRHPALFLDGLPFSLTLLTILLAHEMGHYLACRYYRIDATLPFFLPAPTPIGTLGAFIRIKSPIYTRRALFDVGVAGPVAGFLVLVPALVAGVGLSRVIPQIAYRGDLVYGVPLAQLGIQKLFFPGVATGSIYLHPIGRAAWVGMLATALNLLPIGQLDGGHILYSLTGKWHRWLSRLFVAALIPLGIFYSHSWLVWAALLFFFNMRHPTICDESPLGGWRVALSVGSLLMFLLTFTLVPVR